MAVSDESAGNPERQPLRLKKRRRYLTDAEWQRIQTHYETDPGRISLRPLADLYDVPRNTVMRRASKGQWKRKDAILTDARKELEQQASEAIAASVAEVKKEITLHTRKAMADLAPWMEQKKQRHIKSLVTLGERGVSRVRKMMKQSKPTDAKEEAFIAKTADTYDGIVRRNLGMNDSTGLSGSLSVRVLTDGAAIELSSPVC